MSGSVCAVVVTFNRKELLRGCLAALRGQTRPLDQILVVNNHSTDGTEALLAAEFADLPVLHLPENCGGAAGFETGMRWAYERGHEWIWVMDDDIVPYPGALELMLPFGEISHFIHSRREWPDGEINPLEAIWNLSSCVPMNYSEDLSFQGNDRPWISVNYGNFEGALVNRSVIDKIGYPDRRFFIAGDDTIYGFLASFHTNVLYLRAVGFHKALERPKERVTGRLSYYVLIRNRFLLREHLRGKGALVDDSVFWFSLLRLVVWAVKDAARGFRPGWRTNVGAVLGGLRDGARGRFGRPPWIPA
jgi:GT2 family glycosyltransferase